MQYCFIFIYIAVAMMVANGDVQDLHVNVIPVQSRFASVQNVNVVLKYSNLGNDMMTVLKWFVPEKGLLDPLFEVTRDGETVEYVGPIAKRRAPIDEDLISLSPGMEISTVVELSSVYNMTQSGNYVIQYKMNADQVVYTTDNMQKNKQSLSKEYVLESPPVVVFSAAHRNFLVEQAAQTNTQTRALTPSYIGCSSSQASQVNSAMSAAESYSNNAVQYLNGPTYGSRYTTWFGTYSQANWLTARSHFTKIQSALSTKQLSFDCTCPAAGSGTYAYVYPNQPYKIFLCGAYWPSPTTGTDGKGGTIIHELAHFSILAGTSDHAYGQSSCKSLAQSSPTRALANSDSLQYFVENNPYLN